MEAKIRITKQGMFEMMHHPPRPAIGKKVRVFDNVPNALKRSACKTFPAVTEEHASKSEPAPQKTSQTTAIPNPFGDLLGFSWLIALSGCAAFA